MSSKTLFGIVALVVVLVIGLFFILSNWQDGGKSIFRKFDSKTTQQPWWEDVEETPLVNILGDEGYQSIIDWTEGYIQVSGRGTVDPAKAVSEADAYSMAEKTARMLAYEKLAETINGISLTSTTTLKDEKLASSSFSAKVEATIKFAREVGVRREQMSDGSPMVVVTMGVFINDNEGLSKVTLPYLQDKTRAEVVKKYLPKTRSDENYTGVIVDASGLNIQPAMAPRIVTTDGREIFGSMADLDIDWAIQHGVAGYAVSVEQAMKLKDRIGDNPIVVRALNADKADAVLSNDEAERLAAANMSGEFLNKCRIVFVISNSSGK